MPGLRFLVANAPGAGGADEDRRDEAVPGWRGAEEDYVRYAYGLADDYQRHGKLGTADNHRIVLRKLEAFLKRTQRRTTLPFEDLTPELLRRFQSFLATEYGTARTRSRRT